jgi:hypothetical protein
MKNEKGGDEGIWRRRKERAYRAETERAELKRLFPPRRQYTKKMFK